ncbi:MAG: NusA N-terminal domain-containing protein [Acidobacteriota bacterium]
MPPCGPRACISSSDAKKISPKAVEGDVLEILKDTEGLGRIAASAAKQVIYQKVREAERENIFGEYSSRIGEVVNGTVKRFERGDIIVDLALRRCCRARSRSGTSATTRATASVIVEVSKSTAWPARSPCRALARSSS